jgi:uncharacterized protein (DUF1697 family)
MSKQTRYAAFLRGVMPSNANMTELVRAFEAAGFSNVATVLGSGNVVFTASVASESALQRKAETAMTATLGRSFYTIVRTIDDLRALLSADPFAAAKVPPGSKRTVSFSRESLKLGRALPIEREGARILGVSGKHAFCAYLPNPRGPVFMELIKETFGESVTTRTWDTVQKVVAKAAGDTHGKRVATK